MFALIFIINIISLFCLICALNVIRTRYKITNASRWEKIYYHGGFISLNGISLLLCLHQWKNPGWLIWINLTSINALLIALILGFYPSIYTKWIKPKHKN